MHTDDSRAAEEMGVRVFHAEDNLGPSRGCNIGFRAAIKGEYNYVCKIDPDTVFFSNDWLEESEKIMNKNPGTGILGNVRNCYSIFDKLNSIMDKMGKKLLFNKRNFNHVQGGFQFIRCSALQLEGLYSEFDEPVFEDVELSWRFLHNGWDINNLDGCICFAAEDYINLERHIIKNTKIYHPIKSLSIKKKIKEYWNSLNCR